MKLIASFFSLSMIFTNSYAQDSTSIHAKDSTSIPAKDTTSHPTDQKVAPWYVDRFRLSAGFFVPITNTDMQVGIKGGSAGTPVDLKKDLGYNGGQVTFLANFQWRISRKSRLNLNYYNIPEKSTHKLTKDITFKDTTYHVNTTVNSFFNTAIYQVSYGYAIISKPRYEVGIMIGAHIVGAKAGISVDATAGSGARATDFKVTAPLPDLGLWGGYTFSDRFAVNLDIDYLSLTVNNITGSIFAYNLLFMYRAMDKLDISLGYAGLNFDLDAERKGATASFHWGYNGPALGVTYAFGKTSWKH